MVTFYMVWAVFYSLQKPISVKKQLEVLPWKKAIEHSEWTAGIVQFPANGGSEAFVGSIKSP